MKLSMLNGVWSDIGQGLVDFFYRILNWILKGMCYIVDVCQTLVKKLAGIDAEGMLYGNQVVNGSETSGTVTGDLVEILIRSDLVRNLFISLLVLGIVLLFIVTFVGVWKTEWDFGKEGNSKTKIINSAFRALFNFIAVPVIAFFGIFVGNALLRAIDGATGGGEDKSMTSFVLSSAYSEACRVEYRNSARNNQWYVANLKVEYEEDGETLKSQGILNYFKDGNRDISVEDIIGAFEDNWTIPKSTMESEKYRIYNADGTIATEYNAALDAGEFTFTYNDEDLVSMFFDNSKVNYILIYIILIFMIKAMLTMTFGLVKRLYYVVVLFIISPPIVAISPLNDKALGSWRSLFIANVCSAFVTIALYNIFLSLYPSFAQISFPSVGNFVNFFVHLLMIAVGLSVINELSGEIAKLFGVGEAYSQSVDKNGKTLWGGAFQKAGSGFQPLTFPAKAVGKGIQYGVTGVYKGMGAMAKQMYGDAKGTLGKTPVGDFAKGTGAPDAVGSIASGIKGIGSTENKDVRAKRLQAKDEKKAVKNAHGDSLADYQNAARELGYGADVGLMDATVAEIKGNKHFQEMSENQAIIDKYKGIAEAQADLDKFKGDKRKLKGGDREAYQTAKAKMDGFSDEQKRDWKANKQAYQDAQKYMSERTDVQKRHHAYEQQMVDAAEIYKQSEKQRKKETSEEAKARQKDAVTRQEASKQAKKDAKK